MADVLAGLAIGASFLGIALLVLHVGVIVVAAARKWEDSPDLAPMGFIGVGLALGFAAFYLGRGAARGEWGGVDDLSGLVVVLGAASWGFGAAYEWRYRGGQLGPPMFAPLAASLVTGGLLGLSAATLGI
ncbi:hypothetical protein [Nocardioides sp. SYSU DS0663]|uniref:hypothetical protein n=1 Tax=Nocardioides sp. SYSU DS0663 TaxID=3416445 RepID=UPI003F4B9F8C